jgi:membrane protein YdbS with pleckstrin-like domain
VRQTGTVADVFPTPPPPDSTPGSERPPVTLRDGELPWRPVSPALRTVRLIGVAIVFGLLLLAAVVVSLVVSGWVWLAVLGLLVVAAWTAWVVHRQVSAISWVELDEEIVIRKGRLFRTLVSVPYGRLQYVDIQSGPLARAFGIAQCEIHTASPESGGSLPGLPTEEAEALRARLAARGEAQRAGL